LAVTLCRGDIFDAHFSTDRSKTFFHSSSYTANPIACAAALANLDVWQSEPVLKRIAGLSAMQEARLDRFRVDRRFRNVRQIGTIAALDIAVDDEGYLADIGPRLYSKFIERNFLVRPLGNTIYLMPPYCTTADDLDAVYQAIDECTDLALRR
jgi:adenosylmethionine-8-amino-7-oxononanoate aminotransferase